MINRFKERMLQIDPNYGSQKHQRDFLERYEECQRRWPCTEDHEHENKCYPYDAMQIIIDWQKSKG